MREKFDRLFKEDPEFAKAVEQVTIGLMPTILENLILDGKFDKSRIHDVNYIWLTVMQNLDVIEKIRRSVRIDNELMDSARDAAKQNRITVVVILVATAIEHHLNMFFRDTLEGSYELSDKEVTEAIRSNTNAKLGWLFKIVSEKDMANDLEKRIRQIIELRNGFVHYKSIATSLNENDKIVEMVRQAETIGIEAILNTPIELESELSSIYASMFPEHATAIELAKEAFDIMMESVQNKSD